MSRAELKLNIFRLIDQIEDEDKLSQAYQWLLALFKSESKEGSFFAAMHEEESIKSKCSRSLFGDDDFGSTTSLEEKIAMSKDTHYT